MSSATIAAGLQFAARITADDPPTLIELIRLLDDLVQTYHFCPSGDVSDGNADYPAHDEPLGTTYRIIAERFPKLGLYAVADPSITLMEQPLVADAIDDLADIVLDLRRSARICEMLGPEDAHWDFRFSFESHWGEHLRRLSWYLHLLQRDW